MDDTREAWRPESHPALDLRPPGHPRDPMEFLSRSWSASAFEVSKALADTPLFPLAATVGPISEDVAGELEGPAVAVSGNPFSFASAATSQLVMERIMSQSHEVSPLTSGRLSHSSGPLTGGGSLSDSPPLSPSQTDALKYCRSSNAPKPQPHRVGGKTVGRWLKERREKKKEETRAHNAHVHAAVSVAAVAAAVAAIAATTAAASGSRGKDGRASRTDMAVASAATLVAAHCVEFAESMGAEREHLAAAVGSAVNVRTPGDIVTITAAAATALRGAATLKARALKEAWNIAAVIPVEKGGIRTDQHRRSKQQRELGSNGSSFSDELALEEQETLARGNELLKRTRKGALHWKTVSVYINKMDMVMLKMKSRHVAGTITKKKKSVVIDVCKDVEAWPGRHMLEGAEQRCYFGVRTAEHRVIEFECRGQREYEMWTQGISRLLGIVAERSRLAR